MPSRGHVYGRCPKCNGNLFTDRDRFGDYAQCLQCGYVRYLEAVPKVQSPVYSGMVIQSAKTSDVPG